MFEFSGFYKQAKAEREKEKIIFLHRSDYVEYQELCQYMETRNRKIIETFAENFCKEKIGNHWFENIKEFYQLRKEWIEFFLKLDIDSESSKNFVGEILSSLKGTISLKYIIKTINKSALL